MSSRTGLWLSRRRSVSPRVPTVEYARSERSSAKSSQAAWNSALSAARSSGLRRRQAGSTLKKVNLTNVRPVTGRRLVAAVLAAGALGCGSPGLAAASSTVTVAMLPRDTTVADLARVARLSPGLLSAGVGSVPSEQTFLDASQGNRIDDSLYEKALPGLYPFAREVPGWSAVLARAKDAPADLVPGLLAARLRSAGVVASAEQPMTAPAVIAADPAGSVAPLQPGGCRDRCLVVENVSLEELRDLVARARGDDLLIAIAAPPPASNRALPIGIAGRGFEGDLTSDSTRTEGYVLSTDLASTILERFGIS